MFKIIHINSFMFVFCQIIYVGKIFKLYYYLNVLRRKPSILNSPIDLLMSSKYVLNYFFLLNLFLKFNSLIIPFYKFLIYKLYFYYIQEIQKKIKFRTNLFKFFYFSKFNYYSLNFVFALKNSQFIKKNNNLFVLFENKNI